MVEKLVAELVEPALHPWGRPRDAEGGDEVAVMAVHRDGETGEPDLELVQGHRPAAPAGPLPVATQVVEVGDRGRGRPVEGLDGWRDHAVGEEHLAERGAVDRHVDLGPVAAAEQVT